MLRDTFGDAFSNSVSRISEKQTQTTECYIILGRNAKWLDRWIPLIYWHLSEKLEDAKFQDVISIVRRTYTPQLSYFDTYIYIYIFIHDT
jgi:hypothetical protein